MKWMRTSRVVSMLILAAGSGLLLTDYASAEDDSSRLVARLADLQGAVYLRPSGAHDWLGAEPRSPIAHGDRLWVGEDSRAELHLASAAMQLADRTGFSFLSLADGVVQIQLTEGAISLRVDELHEHDVFEIDTPNLAFSLLRPGNYRVEVHEGAATFVSVRSGAGEVVGGGRSFTMDSDQRAVFLGTQPLEAHPLEPDSTRLTATAEEPAASPLPIDSMARPESRTQASDRSGPGVEADLPHNRPNSARPIILPGNPPGDFPGDLPAKSPYEEGLERVHQRQTEKLLRRQEQQRLRLEQKHLEKVQKGSLPGETPQLQRQHRKLEARQAMLRDQLTRMQQQEKHNLQIVEKLRHSRKRVTRP